MLCASKELVRLIAALAALSSAKADDGSPQYLGMSRSDL
eukprot:SAG31_NODE_24584_length_478_cov_1.089710_1_plen_38_part_10